jgi:hypothetical protein
MSTRVELHKNRRHKGPQDFGTGLCAQHGAHASVVLIMPFDSPSDGHHDLPFLLVGFHVLVGFNNAFQ